MPDLLSMGGLPLGKLHRSRAPAKRRPPTRGDFKPLNYKASNRRVALGDMRDNQLPG